MTEADVTVLFNNNYGDTNDVNPRNVWVCVVATPTIIVVVVVV